MSPILDAVNAAIPNTSPLLILPSLALLYYLTVGYRYHGTTAKLRHIPSVGYEQPILYYWNAIKFYFRAEEMLREGSLKATNTGIFKYPGLLKWIVVTTDPKMMSELFRAPEHQLSMHEAFEETVQMSYTFGKNIASNHYHAETIRNHLTKGMHTLVPKIHDELATSFRETIPPTEDWQAVPMRDTILTVVARVSNRIFVGLPLCRNPDYVDLNIQFTLDAIKTSTLFALVPALLRPILALFDNHVQRGIRRAVKHLVPEIAARRKYIAEGADSDEFLDFLTWLIQEAEGDEQSDHNLSSRVLATNFAAIHTSSMTFSHAIYYLASNQEWIKLLRGEAEDVINRCGWTKDAVDQLHIIDSFVKETQRLKPLGLLMSRRVAVVDWSFSNGCNIPAGTSLSTSLLDAHYNTAVYSDPYVFDPLRFVKMRTEDKTARLNMVSTSPSSLVFGHGRHACPGRFFAAAEIKLMMAHLVLEYDFKLEQEGVRPSDMWFGVTCNPNLKAKVLFRKRRG